MFPSSITPRDDRMLLSHPRFASQPHSAAAARNPHRYPPLAVASVRRASPPSPSAANGSPTAIWARAAISRLPPSTRAASTAREPARVPGRGRVWASAVTRPPRFERLVRVVVEGGDWVQGFG